MNAKLNTQCHSKALPKIFVKLKEGLEPGQKYNSIKQQYSTCDMRANHKIFLFFKFSDSVFKHAQHYTVIILGTWQEIGTRHIRTGYHEDKQRSQQLQSQVSLSNREPGLRRIGRIRVQIIEQDGHLISIGNPA